MKKLFGRLWKDDQGALIATEYLFVATILVIGIVVGLANLQAAVNTELTEMGNAILALDLSYSYSGTSGTNGGSNGSAAADTPAASLTLAPVTPTAVNIDVPVP